MQKIEDSGFAPSFSCYSSGGTTSTAIAKAIREEGEIIRFHKNGAVEGEEFEFSLVVENDEESFVNETDSQGWTVFPVFKRDLQVNDEVDRQIKSTDDEIDASSAITSPLGKVFIGEREYSSSYSSSETDRSESPRSTGSGSPPVITKCKKSRSTGSGSKRWIFRYLLRRSNSEGKEPLVLLTPKKVDSPEQKRNSGEVLRTGGRWKAETPVHERFYVQRRAENEIGKRKSYLPYRKDLLGLFANANGMGKMLPF